MKYFLKLLFVAPCFVAIFCNANHESKESNSLLAKVAPTEKNYNFKVVKSYRHHKNFFTQGFYYDNKTNKIYEGTGRFGKSGIFVYPLGDEALLQKKMLPKNYFGEGITVFNNQIFQLTWQNHLCFVYDQKSLQLSHRFLLATEGWGITHNDTSLIVSDGSDKLYFYTPSMFQLIKTIRVSDHNGAIDRLNELEYINGYVFANIWMTNEIVVIDPSQGKVVGKIDLNELLQSMGFDNSKNRDAVLNGIAYNKNTNTIYLTGKLWPIIFEIQLL